MPIPTFDEVYAAELAYVMNCLRRFSVPARDVEDLAHDAFVVVHRRLADYDVTRPIRPWLFGIAYRVVCHWRRGKRRRPEAALSETDADRIATDSTTTDPDRIADRLLVQRAVEAVALERRAVFLLHDVDGYSMPEVAAALSLPLNTAYSRLRLARGEFTAAAQRMLRGRGGS